ncbi:MAG: DUF512 domain-containing protein [Bacteroidales bacterium]|nr:DUF512 domain-containing protein [Bacteroidales bacterium]
MKQKGHMITSVSPDSIGEELGLEVGDILLEINGALVGDIFDFHYLVNDVYVEILIQKENGEEWLLEIDKEYDEGLGIEFENGLMDEYRTCTNKCMFCFIDQMPQGMRETLYFKDDDSRLSFLQGNYITLTNMKDKDIKRIIEYKLSPINLSIHTTNPELRCEMLHNRFAGEALKKIDTLYEAETQMNGQIVLCKGVNDGEELERSIKDLTKYLPYLESVSVVPVGLTKFRDGLHKLDPFTKEDARDVLDIIHRWQHKLYIEHGNHFIHAGDEWYILAGYDMPSKENYDGYVQLENGVGMVRLFSDEFEEALELEEGDNRSFEISLATGVLAYDLIQSAADKLMIKYPSIQIHVYKIINDYFGEKITVAGLLTGEDLIKQLKERKLGERLLLPIAMFKSGEKVFLDDISLDELETALQVPVNIVKSSGQDFIDTILQRETDILKTREGGKYEL